MTPDSTDKGSWCSSEDLQKGAATELPGDSMAAPAGGEVELHQYRAPESCPPSAQAVVNPAVGSLWRWGPFAWGAVAVVTVLLVGGIAWFNSGHGKHSHGGGKDLHGEESAEVAGLAVKTIHAQKKTLVRTLTIPGTIRPWAQAELYAKVPGYLKMIQRERSPRLMARLAVLAAANMAGSHNPLNDAASLAANVELAHWFNPQKDIGSYVEAGELLMEIAAPEMLQDIVKKQTVILQREAELEEARTAVATLEAQVKSAEAYKEEVEADIQKAAAEHTYRSKQLERLEKLVADRTITADNLDEKQHQVQATAAAWKSSQAKLRTAQAQILAVSSKSATARAEIGVKELQVRAARDELQTAQILAEYSRLYAPFKGVITQRGVDEGDFVQNATSGQTRTLMTVTAIDKVKVVLQVPEQGALWVEPGTEAVLRVEGRQNLERKGWVTRVGHVLDPNTHTMQVEIDLDNRDRRLKPGMYGQVTLMLQQIPNTLALPASAISSRKGKNFIIEVQDGFAHYYPVRLRYDDGLEVEAVKLAGGKETPLTGNEVIVSSNRGEISEGQRIAAAH